MLTTVCLIVVDVLLLTCTIGMNEHCVDHTATNHGQLFKHSKSKRRCQAVDVDGRSLRGELRKTEARQREHGFENLGHCLLVKVVNAGTHTATLG